MNEPKSQMNRNERMTTTKIQPVLLSELWHATSFIYLPNMKMHFKNSIYGRISSNIFCLLIGYLFLLDLQRMNVKIKIRTKCFSTEVDIENYS